MSYAWCLPSAGQEQRKSPTRGVNLKRAQIKTEQQQEWIGATVLVQIDAVWVIENRWLFGYSKDKSSGSAGKSLAV